MICMLPYYWRCIPGLLFHVIHRNETTICHRVTYVTSHLCHNHWTICPNKIVTNRPSTKTNYDKWSIHFGTYRSFFGDISSKTCKQFAQVFLDQLSNMADEYDDVRLVFDRYIYSSLKEQMRRKRTKGKSTYYHFKDTTLIQNISLKDFLSNIKTKAELTTHLAAKTTDHSKGPTNKLKKFIVTSGTEPKGNICVPSSLVTHSQEEADTLLLLHVLSIDRHAEVVIASPDTVVFLLMIQMYPSLRCNISFLTGKGNLKRNIPVQPVYNKLGHRRASSIGPTWLSC